MKKSGASGETLKEAQAINKSLSALGDVISALATDQVPCHELSLNTNVVGTEMHGSSAISESIGRHTS